MNKSTWSLGHSNQAVYRFRVAEMIGGDVVLNYDPVSFCFSMRTKVPLSESKRDEIKREFNRVEVCPLLIEAPYPKKVASKWNKSARIAWGVG